MQERDGGASIFLKQHRNVQGKTTLLNVLAQRAERLGTVGGALTLGGRPLSPAMRRQ